MNKFIKTDLEQAVTYMEIAIMNALYDIDFEEEEINLGYYISKSLFYKCLKESNWKEDSDSKYWISPSNKVCHISGFDEKNCRIKIVHV